jgi:hypothetical protein
VAFLRFTPVAKGSAALIALAAIAILPSGSRRERSVSAGTSSFRIHHLNPTP